MKKNKFQKGHINYIVSHRINRIIWTMLLFAISFALLAVGYFSTGSIRNYLTIPAMLGILPASRAAVSMVIALKVNRISEETYQKLEKKSIDAMFQLQYNLYFTSESKNYAVDAMFITNNSIIGYKFNPPYACKDLKNHIELYMNKDGYHPNNIQIFSEESKFLLALKNNHEKKPSENDLRMEYDLKLLSV